MATLAELGRYPLYIDIHKKMIKYFQRFKTLKRERLLYKAYLEQKSGIKGNDTNWLTRIKDILNRTGFSFVFDIKEINDTNKTQNIDTKLAYEIQQRSKDIFEQQTLYHLEEKEVKSEGKLVFYSKIKRKYRKELYLQLQNIKNRNAIRNIRISTHILNIETGRYKGINRDERICDLCSLNTVETEIHFLTECPTFNEERISFLNNLNTNHNLQTDKMEINLIKEIMLCEDLSILNTFGKYIRSCFDKCKDQINSEPNPTTV